MTPAETWYAHFRRDRKRKAEVIETIEAVQREALDEAADLADEYGDRKGLSTAMRNEFAQLAEKLRGLKP